MVTRKGVPIIRVKTITSCSNFKEVNKVYGVPILILDTIIQNYKSG